MPGNSTFHTIISIYLEIYLKKSAGSFSNYDEFLSKLSEILNKRKKITSKQTEISSTSSGEGKTS